MAPGGEILGDRELQASAVLADGEVVLDHALAKTCGADYGGPAQGGSRLKCLRLEPISGFWTEAALGMDTSRVLHVHLLLLGGQPCMVQQEL